MRAPHYLALRAVYAFLCGFHQRNDEDVAERRANNDAACELWDVAFEAGDWRAEARESMKRGPLPRVALMLVALPVGRPIGGRVFARVVVEDQR